MRFVPIKSIDQQVRLSWHRVREGYKVESLAMANRLRGLLAEFGHVVARGDHALRIALADLDDTVALPGELRGMLRELGTTGHTCANASPPVHASRQSRGDAACLVAPGKPLRWPGNGK